MPVAGPLDITAGQATAQQPPLGWVRGAARDQALPGRRPHCPGTREVRCFPSG